MYDVISERYLCCDGRVCLCAARAFELAVDNAVDALGTERQHETMDQLLVRMREVQAQVEAELAALLPYDGANDERRELAQMAREAQVAR
jgi:hypothetical protein